MRRHRLIAAFLTAGLGATTALAQPVIEGTESIDFDRPEAWAMKYFASVALPTTFGGPEPLAAGDVDLTLEYVQIPSLDEAERRVGFGGFKVEDLNKSPYLLRPVVAVGLGRKLTLEAGYVPPVDRNGAEASLLTLALGRPLVESDRFRFGLRLHAAAGSIEGDFTCSADTAAAGDDPVRNPFGCEAASRDEYDLSTLGLEASAAWALGSEERWEPFVALSYNRMDLEFQVNARYAGLIDRTRLETDGETFYAVAGVGYRLAPAWRLAGEVFYSPLDVVRPPDPSTRTDELVNLRAVLSYRLR